MIAERQASGHLDFRARFAPALELIERELFGCVTGTEHAEGLYGMIQYHLGFASATFEQLDEQMRGKRGKRMRALLPLSVGSSLSVPLEVLEPVLLAGEMMHSASLVHDDIEDQDAVRWNRPTVWKLFGVEHGINVGDAMTALTYRTLSSLTPAVSPRQALSVIQTFVDAHLSMTEGQYLDMAFASGHAASLEQYLTMIALKTAASCSCVCRAAAIVGSASPAVADAYADYGHNFGMFYQICDDIAGVWGDEICTGKRTLQDVIGRKSSLPMICARAKDDQHVRELVELITKQSEVLEPRSLDDTLRFELEKMGVHKTCWTHAERFYQETVNALERTGLEGPGTDALRLIVELCRDTARAFITRPAQRSHERRLASPDELSVRESGG